MEFGIPNNAWLGSRKVYNAKKKHLCLLNLLEIKPSQSDKLRILDAGCGTGLYGLILAENKDYEVIGVDITKTAIEKAKELAIRQNVSFYPMVGDLERLPFKDNTFDVVFSGRVLHHFPSLKNACSELCRVSNNGGIIAIVEINEANFALKVSRFVESIIGWGKLNRIIHFYDDYIREFEKAGVKDIHYSSCYAPLPPLTNDRRFIMKLLYTMRAMIFSIGMVILPRPLNGQDLLIKGMVGKQWQ